MRLPRLLPTTTNLFRRKTAPELQDFLWHGTKLKPNRVTIKEKENGLPQRPSDHETPPTPWQLQLSPPFPPKAKMLWSCALKTTCDTFNHTAPTPDISESLYIRVTKTECYHFCSLGNRSLELAIFPPLEKSSQLALEPTFKHCLYLQATLRKLSSFKIYAKTTTPPFYLNPALISILHHLNALFFHPLLYFPYSKLNL